MKQTILPLMLAMLLCANAQAQVNSGSNGSDGSDGAFNPTTNIVINMADHPDGIYQYTSVNISSGVTVTFIPNANNTPVVWLVQSNCVINGGLDLSGQSVGTSIAQGGIGGPGGWRGGSGGLSGTSGQGPGGGAIGEQGQYAAHATLPLQWNGSTYVSYTNGTSIYGNKYLLPLLGGSGGGGGTNTCISGQGGGGGGGGGAILIAASQSILLNGNIIAGGGRGARVPCFYTSVLSGGCGSGGSVRLVTSTLTGNGGITVSGGTDDNKYAGQGRVRIDVLDSSFSGSISGGLLSQGSQFLVIPTAGQGAQLTVASVGGVPVSASPAGQLSTPDAVLSAQQNNPIPIVVHCSNLPLNTQITVSVKPANAPAVSATGLNSSGTLASSTATVSIVMPRGGGLIYATAATGN